MENSIGIVSSNIRDKVLELEGEKRAILDVSTYPALGRMSQTNLPGSFVTYYVPDTIAKLLSRGKEDRQYYYFMTRLFTRWTRRYIDLGILDRMFIERKYPGAKVELITEEIVDKEVYSFCYKNFVSKDLIVELSPKFNLVGDIIGKILGFAKKSGVPILMMSQRLVRDVKVLIPIFEAANTFFDHKHSFFVRLIPGIERTRGIRWIIGITIGVAISPVGFVLAVIDP